jgi:hypothetical protein
LCGQHESLKALRPELPDELIGIVERCLSKRPEDRIANMAELAQALEPFASTAASPRLPRARLSTASAFVVDTRSDRGSEHTPAPRVDTIPPVPPKQRRARRVARWPAALALGALTGALLSTVDWQHVGQRVERNPAAFLDVAGEEAGRAASALGEGYRHLSRFVVQAPAQLDALIRPCTSFPTPRLGSAGTPAGQTQLDPGTSERRGIIATFHRELAAMCTGHVSNE